MLVCVWKTQLKKECATTNAWVMLYVCMGEWFDVLWVFKYFVNICDVCVKVREKVCLLSVGREFCVSHHLREKGKRENICTSTWDLFCVWWECNILVSLLCTLDFLIEISYFIVLVVFFQSLHIWFNIIKPLIEFYPLYIRIYISDSNILTNHTLFTSNPLWLNLIPQEHAGNYKTISYFDKW